MDWSEKCHPLEWYFLFQAGINSDSECDGGMPKPASQARRCTFDAPHLRLSGLSSTLTGDHTRRCLDSLEGISPATPPPPATSRSGQPRKRRQFSRQSLPFSSLPPLATRKHILASQPYPAYHRSPISPLPLPTSSRLLKCILASSWSPVLLPNT